MSNMLPTYESHCGAAGEERTEQVQAVESSMKPQRPRGYDRRRRNGMIMPTVLNRNLLHTACDRGSVAFTNSLVQSGIDVNITDQEGRSALHMAAQNGHVGCVRALIACPTCQIDLPRIMPGIMPSNNNSHNDDGFPAVGDTALQMALENEHTAVVYWLLHRGANPARCTLGSDPNTVIDTSSTNQAHAPSAARALVTAASLAIANTTAAQDKDTFEQRIHRVRVALGYMRLGNVCKHPRRALAVATGVPDVVLDETMATYIA